MIASGNEIFRFPRQRQLSQAKLDLDLPSRDLVKYPDGVRFVETLPNAVREAWTSKKYPECDLCIQQVFHQPAFLIYAEQAFLPDGAFRKSVPCSHRGKAG